MSLLFDVIIRRGQVIDGTRRKRFRADVGISGERITAIGDLDSAESRLDIDASDHIVAPLSGRRFGFAVHYQLGGGHQTLAAYIP